jgi:ABC-type glycerol-3-phosphate transport system substrate-binding protein
MSPKAPETDVRYHNATSNYDNNMSFNANITDEKMDRTLEFLDWACSPEGEKIATMGFEGKHYEKKDGVEVSIVPSDEDGVVPKYWEYEAIAMFARFVPTWNFEFAITSPFHPEGNRKLANDYKTLIQNEATICDANWGIEYYSSEARDNMPSISEDYNAMYMKAMTGKEDIEKLFDEFVQQSLVKAQEAIDDTNKYAQSMGW